MNDSANLHIPARDIPVPGHMSPEAQAWLAMPRAAACLNALRR